MEFRYTNGQNPDFFGLCRELDDFLNELAGGEENRAQYIAHNTLEDVHDVILVYDGERAVGGAGFKRFDDQSAEVKRVFLRGEYRGKGISRMLMKHLEEAARNQGYAYLILETGETLTAAMGLYRSIGYEVIPNYGPYVGMEDSICMKKKL